MIEKIADLTGFEQLRKEWDDLLQASAANCLFLTWEWMFAWWNHLRGDRELFILTVRSGHELLAIAPFALRTRRLVGVLPVRSLEFLGTGSVGSDYLDLIVRRGRERDAVEALGEYLVREQLMVEMAQVKRNSGVAAELARELRSRGWSLAETKTSVCPFIKLSGHSWESYLATLGSEHRYNFRRRLKNATRQFDLRFEQVHSEGERREALAALVALHQMRWRERGGSDGLHTQDLLAFHEELSRIALERGWLRLFVMSFNGEPAASLYGFRYQHTFYYYQSGLDPAYSKCSVGLLAMGLAIKSAIEEGVEEYDLLHGDERYKFHWAKEARELFLVEAYPPRTREWLYKGVRETSRAAKRIARQVLPETVAARIFPRQRTSLRRSAHSGGNGQVPSRGTSQGNLLSVREKALSPIGHNVRGRVEGLENLPVTLAFDALVLDARLRQSLVTVRSLGRRGLSVAALESFNNVPTFSSRWCQQGFVCAADEGTDAYLAYLEQVLERTGARVLIPSSDGTIELLRQHRARLEQRARIALANQPAMTIAVNKGQTLAVAKRLGIGVPRGLVVSTVSEVPAALKEIGLPAVVKPAESWLWDKQHGARVGSLVVTTPDEARRAVAELTRFGGVTLFQQLLSGRREAVSFLYADGKMYARFAQWAKRTRPQLGGESVLRQSIAVPHDIGEQAERLVREIDLEGYSEVEFRRDSAGVPYLMEINPRLSASVEIAVRSGVDFPYLLYQWASGGPIDQVESYRTGGWMRYLAGDIMTTITALKQQGRPEVTPPVQAVLDFGLAFCRPMGYDYLDWKDPLPAVKATTDFTRYLVGGGYQGNPVPFKEETLGGVVSNAETSPQSVAVAQFDAVVVGAGPYGLSTAAHLLGRGLTVAVFGKPVELWRNHMPKGMLLRSHWWATNLSDPLKQYGFERFFRDSKKYDKCYPVPIEAFIDYALWFQARAVPHVDETYVSSIERKDNQFLLTLEDGRKVSSAAVVMATGLYYYANRPEEYNHLPAGLVSHSGDHKDFSRLKGKQVVVIGGGQSAIEFAALLHEAGATVHVVSRRPIVWLAPDRANERTIFEQILAPNAGIAPGWKNWVLEKMPYFFYRFSQHRKDKAIRNYYMAAASDWLRDRVIGKATLHEGHTVVKIEEVDGKVDATISDGEKVRADHVMLATGFKVDINKLTMIHPSLLTEIETDTGIPILNHCFDSSVPGLYFVGLTSLRAFGPLYRFVLGCSATARRVASSIARKSCRVSHAPQDLPIDV
jgi:cation diffusion facilitator CzcD-associated flavoprotein CzcO/CelD/BcsL family acetyltransferase involved in cellulose biosynthesis/predicted ATP-grasp superfamily ATP-dependent carboligase